MEPPVFMPHLALKPAFLWALVSLHKWYHGLRVFLCLTDDIGGAQTLLKERMQFVEIPWKC